MVTHMYELEGCTPSNIAGVEGSLSGIENCSIHQTARGGYMLLVDAETSPTAQVQAKLAPMHVKPVEAERLPSMVLRRSPTINR